MTDRRLLRSNGRVAHRSLEGTVTAAHFVEPAPHRVRPPVATLWRDPGARRDRQLLCGDLFHVLEEKDGFAFGWADKDGYVGYLASDTLCAPGPAPTHLVASRLTWPLPQPDFKAGGETVALPMGATLHVTGTEGRWSAVILPDGTERFVPSVHLRPLTEPETDPVTVAERLIGAPYVWGGNSSEGIDCSGLVQAGLLACGLHCPGDSDLQETSLGETLPEGTTPRRGDLMFWKGHVAWVADEAILLHANAFHMAVAREPIAEAVARIAAQGDGPVTRHARLG